MSAAPSAALRALESALSVLPADQVVTVGLLTEKVSEAARAAEDAEHDAYMGDDQ